MAAAGYDPVAMADFFELLRAEQGRDPSKLERFFSDHPPAADREARIRQLASSLGRGNTQIVGGFDGVKTRMRKLGPAAPQQVVTTFPQAQDTVVTGQVTVQVDRPSSRLVRFAQPNGFFTVDYPDNWRAYPSGWAVSMAPEGGVVATSDGRQVMLYGVIINHYTPFSGTYSRRDLRKSYAPFEDRTGVRGQLADATNDLIGTILESNPYLQPVESAARSEVIDGAEGLSLVLTGRSPVTGEEERVTAYTRALLDGHVLYALGIAPGSDYRGLENAFARMMRTMVVNDQTAHRASRADLRAGGLGAGLRARPRP